MHICKHWAIVYRGSSDNDTYIFAFLQFRILLQISILDLNFGNESKIEPTFFLLTCFVAGPTLYQMSDVTLYQRFTLIIRACLIVYLYIFPFILVKYACL